MKKKLLLFMALICFIAGNAQINPTRGEHYEVPCEQEITNPGCNMILNPAFQTTGDYFEDFSDGEVVMWQDVNNLTTDINGAHATNGWTQPAVPGILTGANYASMLVDNLNLETEGIAGRTFPLVNGNKYALSFFLASSKLDNYRNQEGTYTLKIYLTNCQNFSTDASGNPEITGDKQLIYCREFKPMGESEWQQYLVSFTVDNDYNMIVIYPEISEQNYDGGTYVHFLYPELIPINPTSQYQTYEIPGWTDYSDPQNPVAYPAVTEGITLLTACGVSNASYQWEGPNGIVSNRKNDKLGYDPAIGENDEYNFSMWVEGAMGNNLENCGDAEPPLITETAVPLPTVEMLTCADPVPPTSCNLIPNAGFATVNPLPTEEAFWQNNVLNWASVNGGTPDINGIPPFINPPSLPSPLSNINMAGFVIHDGSSFGLYYEGICAKTAPVIKNKKYAFSFFIASDHDSNNNNFPLGAHFTFKVVLTKCQNFPTTPIFVPGVAVPPSMPIKQEIFCKSMNGLQDSDWQQYFVTFTANDDYDMIVIYPEQPSYSFVGATYLFFLMPELIDVTNLVTVTQNSACNYTLVAPCAVTNATYAWTDGDGNLIGTSNPITVDASINPPLYRLTMSVPGLLTSPGNTCGNNVNNITALAFGSEATWVGGSGSTLATRRDWNTAANWNPAVVPNNALTDVRIPSTTYKPFIASGTFQINSIVIESGGSLINNGLLRVARNITGASQSIDNRFYDPNTNTSTSVITGSIEMNGTCKAQILAGTVFGNSDVKNFIVSNNVTLTSMLDVIGELSFGGQSRTLTTGGNLTLVSTATTTANVAQIHSSNFITGDVTVERHILTGIGSGEHGPKWQALATPTGANSIGQTVKQSWMENGLTTSTPNGYGTNIPDVRSNWAALGFDQQAANSNSGIKTYNSVNNVFDPIANTGISLYNKNGYFLFVRGDRSAVNYPDLNPTNLRSKGALFQPHTGYTPPSVTVAGGPKFELVGNPYASAIDIDYMRTNGNFSNLTNHVTVWDPLIPGTLGLGGYQVLSAPSYTPTPGGTLGNTHYVTGVPCTEIQSGQAFFMQTSGSGAGTITFDESIKSTNSRVVTRGINASISKSFRANLFSATGICDGNAIIYDNKFRNDIDDDDAGRPFNPGENFMIRKENNKFLTVEARDIIKHTDSIFYIFKNLRKIKYQLVFTAENLQQEGLTATLIDNYLQQKISLSLSDSSFVDFMVDDNKASYENRFMVVFNRYDKTAPLVVDKNKLLVDRSFVVYPNPTENKTISIQYANQPTGMYKLQLINYAGQVVINSNIKITDTNGRASVKPGSIAAGSYQLVITAADGRKSVLHVVIK